MKTNSQLQEDVMNELKWEPILNASEIGVSAKDGIVTLTGNVDSYAKKYRAEQAAKRVSGVKAVAQEIKVIIGDSNKRTDEEIARAVLTALKWDTSVPDQDIKVIVNDGWVSLEGEVEWRYQKETASSDIHNLLGVIGVTNKIRVRQKAQIQDVKSKIMDAFKRSAVLDAAKIHVIAEGNKIILAGSVNSWSEREDAETAAWSAPGVSSVENRISVGPEVYA